MRLRRQGGVCRAADNKKGSDGCHCGSSEFGKGDRVLDNGENKGVIKVITAASGID